ncbi:heparinase II/III family protein [Pseudomonadales bacterium]|nr:heparinase II/III family protein [Pseudomonadales bacterium]
MLYDEKIDNQLEACFLNNTKKLDLPRDWNNESLSKLWVYNLHYFEDLLSNNAEKKRSFHLKLLSSWVDQNPVGYGNGWEPYPTSLRIVNILKAWLGGLELDAKLLSSVFMQASFLSNDLEKHLLGNHYFVNLKALLFAGIIFGNHRWVNIAQEELLTEIPEQLLQDGSNFELSPMYHSLMLVDMLDMFNLSKAYPTQLVPKLNSLLEEYIPKMLLFADAMAHPDGGVSFFNDSVDGIAPPIAKIEKYAEKLGFKISRYESDKIQIIDHDVSGYICATTGGNKLIFDVSAVGPDYIPGHAHADTLSFELSLGRERVFVNSGISEYGLSESRLYQRKTRAHNTVEIDNKDSSQVWSGFRVANRARIVERYCELNINKSIFLRGTHDGYKSLFGGCTHSRELIFSEESLGICDEFEGAFRQAKSRFYFHPKLKVCLEDNRLTVVGEGFILKSDLTGKKASLFESVWHPAFGVDLPNKGLLIEFARKKENISFTWTSISNAI